MKKILSLLVLCSLAFSIYAQDNSFLNATRNGQTVAINTDKAYALFPKTGGGAYLLYDGTPGRDQLAENYDTLINYDCGGQFIRITPIGLTLPDTFTTIGVNPKWITEVVANGSGSIVKLKSPKISYRAEEAPDYFQDALVALLCGGGGGGGSVDLSYTAAATQGTVVNSGGNDATIPLATATNAGLHPPTPALTALTAAGVDQAADYIEIWDNSASAYKKILPTFVTAGAITDYAATCTGCNSGSALRVRATGSGVTVTYSSNNFTVNIPSGVLLLDAHFIVTTADVQASADGGGFTDWITFTFNTTGGDGNTGVTTLRTPQVQKVSIPSSGALAANNGASIDNDNNPAVMVIGASSNDLVIRLSGASVGSQGGGIDFSGF